VYRQEHKFEEVVILHLLPTLSLSDPFHYSLASFSSQHIRPHLRQSIGIAPLIPTRIQCRAQTTFKPATKNEPIMITLTSTFLVTLVEVSCTPSTFTARPRCPVCPPPMQPMSPPMRTPRAGPPSSLPFQNDHLALDLDLNLSVSILPRTRITFQTDSNQTTSTCACQPN